MLTENAPWEGDEPIRLELVQNLSRSDGENAQENFPPHEEELELDLNRDRSFTLEEILDY